MDTGSGRVRSRSMLKIELARTADDFELGVRGQRDALRVGLHVDFVFIAAYWLIFTTMSVLFAIRGFWGADWLGAFAGELATIGALADVSENTYTLRLLRRSEGASGDDELGPLAASMRRSSLVKWTSLFAATGLLSVMFFQRGGLNTILGAAYALAASLGILTMTLEAARTKIADVLLGPMLGVAFVGMGLALLVGLPVAASQI